MSKAIVVVPLKPAQRERLCAALPRLSFTFTTAAALSAEQLADCEYLFGNVKPSLLAQAPQLKLLQLNSAGSEAYRPGCFANSKALLCNASGAYGLSISEALLAMQLTLIRHFQTYRDQMHEGKWQDAGNISSVEGSTVLCLGTGDIGQSYARKVKALGGYTIGLRRHQGTLEGFDEMYTMEALDALLPRADVVAMSLPGTPETRQLMNRARLARMKPSAILLNVGRGYSVDTEALTEALMEGRLAGAALDVTEPEPLPPEHPLWALPNVLITPHVAGNFFLAATLERIVDIAIANLSAVLGGRRPARVVDLQEGY